jgi:hypothetical protein
MCCEKQKVQIVRTDNGPADVEVLGWRLGTLADKLQENNLAAVRILPKRYAELERNQPYVAFIGITPIAKG